MTEEEWQNSTNPQRMLDFLYGSDLGRKASLFFCACCRQLWFLLSDERSRAVVELVERVVDDIVEERELKRSWFPLVNAAVAAVSAHEERTPQESAASIAVWTTDSRFPSYGWDHFGLLGMDDTKLVSLVREIAGNPFHPVAIDPDSKTHTVLSLAQLVYDNRVLPAGILEPERLTILADALEDARCDNSDILDHLRGPGPHVRGCWAVDSILGKE